MICEPNFNLPQIIDLEVLRNSEHKKTPSKNGTQDVRPKIFYRQKEYQVLPKFYDQYHNLDAVLSLKDNPYMNCSWRAFLENIPENYIRIRLYADYQKEKQVNVVRRKILNGHFYGMDYKLSPVPQLNDPRRLVV